MHFGVLGERQTVGQVELGQSGGHAKQLWHAEHNEARRPATSLCAVHELQADIDAVVATVSGAARLHDEHDDGAKNLVNVVLNFFC